MGFIPVIQVGSTLEKSSNIIYQASTGKENHMITSIYTGKTLEQNLTPIHDKNSQQNMNRDKGP